MSRPDVGTGFKPVAAIFLLACLILACFAADIRAGSGEAPKDSLPIIRFDREKVDLGKVTQGDIVEHVFLIHNDGDAPLKILKLSPG